jgi:uncharacterized integral membrane protein (TIGR00697 family)
METRMQNKGSLYPYVMAAFAVVLVLSNTTATKLVVFGPFVWTAAIVLFPIAYILGDIITEVYGYARARRIFWAGLAANLLMSATYVIAILLPALDPEFDKSFSAVLGQVPRIVVASMVGVWAGQFANAYVMSKMKVLTKGKYLWARTISSTLVGEFVDTTLFATLGFALVLPWPVLWQMIYSAALFKSAYEALITPVTYVVVNAFKRREGEAFDYDVKYSPFAR